MATSTGKAARKRYGNRYDCKAAKKRSRRRRAFGKLPVSESRGNARAWREGSSEVDAPVVEPVALRSRLVNRTFDLSAATAR